MSIKDFTIIGSDDTGYYFTTQYKGDEILFVIPDVGGSYGHLRFFSLIEAMTFIFWWQGAAKAALNREHVAEKWRYDMMNPERADEAIEEGTEEAEQHAQAMWDEMFEVIDAKNPRANPKRFDASKDGKLPVYRYYKTRGGVVYQTLQLWNGQDTSVGLSFSAPINLLLTIREKEGPDANFHSIYDQLLAARAQTAKLQKELDVCHNMLAFAPPPEGGPGYKSAKKSFQTTLVAAKKPATKKPATRKAAAKKAAGKPAAKPKVPAKASPIRRSTRTKKPATKRD